MSDTDFLKTYKGYLSNILKWEELDQLWKVLREQSGQGWYVYAVGEPVPQSKSEPQQLDSFINELDKLLHQEHDEDYCGIVYVDDRTEPSLVKVYDPNHLGSSCGPGFGEVLPGWILSTIPPIDLASTVPLPANRKRWWQKVFA